MHYFQSLQSDHWLEVKAIYLEGIATGKATFQQEAPQWDEWDIGHLPHSRVVAIREGKVAGWAALSSISRQPVDRGVAEVSIYIGEAHRGYGLGCYLLRELVQQSEENGIWLLQASIFPENRASVRIHEKCGFRLMGGREKIARQNSIWRDTLIYERQSKIVGV